MVGPGLTIEAGERDGGDFDAQLSRLSEKLLAHLVLTQLVFDVRPIAERAHVNDDTVQAAILAQLDCPQFLPLEQHPIARGDLVSLHARGRRLSEDSPWRGEHCGRECGTRTDHEFSSS